LGEVITENDIYKPFLENSNLRLLVFDAMKTLTPAESLTLSN
jgi:hypothetical protein